MKESGVMTDILFRTVLNCKTMEDCADFICGSLHISGN